MRKPATSKEFKRFNDLNVQCQFEMDILNEKTRATSKQFQRFDDLNVQCQFEMDILNEKTRNVESVQAF